MICKKKDDPLDGTPFVVGIITLLKQFHSSNKDLFLAYLGQYVRAQIDGINVDSSSVTATGIPNTSGSSSKGKEIELPPDVTNVLHFLEHFCRFAPTSRRAVESYIPSYLFARFREEVSEKK